MLEILVNNEKLQVETSQLRTIGELVEYVKASIDPETVIITLTKDDSPLSDFDWRTPLSSSDTSSYKIETGSKKEFVSQRLHIVGSMLEGLMQGLNESAQGFKQLRIASANKEFSIFIEDLNAFVGWFHALLIIDNDFFEEELQKFTVVIQRLQTVCGSLQDLQMHSSWWALGDTLNNELKPVLDEIGTITTLVSGKLAS